MPRATKSAAAPVKRARRAAKSTPGEGEEQTPPPARRAAKSTPAAPVKRTRRAATAPADGEEQTPPKPVTALIAGRHLPLRPPTPDQAALMRRVATRLERLGERVQADGNAVGMEEVLRAASTAFSLITAVLANEEDREWLELEVIEGRLEMSDLAPVMSASFEALAERHGGGNRAARRARATRTR